MVKTDTKGECRSLEKDWLCKTIWKFDSIHRKSLKATNETYNLMSLF